MSERQRGTLELGAGDAFPLDGLDVRYDETATALVEESVRRGEAILTAAGALAADTGEYTGRSPRDKFIVRNAASAGVAWGEVNQPMEQVHFDRLLADMHRHARGLRLHAQHLYAGADPRFRLPVRVVTEYAWHALFARNLFLEPEPVPGGPPRRPRYRPGTTWAGWTVVDIPSFRADPERHGTRSSTVIAVDFARRLVLIGNTEYAGEMKKSVFSVLNLALPRRGVFPMHCSANVDKKDASNVALFFGLSGTGKTTLSADPNRALIGDDEHGWSDRGVFNFEGGCYAKCIKLSQEGEPQIWNAIKFGSVLENVDVDPQTRVPDYDSARYTENTRATYPIDYIDGAVIPSVGGHPKNVIFLTADAFGVVPPVSKLTPEQAMYYFINGYTSKLAGTEAGVTEPQPNFSACFGGPFLPRPPRVYADMLAERVAKHGANVWLLNTGWTGGPYGVGSRFKLAYTRAMVTAILNGSLAKAEFEADPVFGLAVPKAVPGVPAEVLNPRNTWKDPAAYDAQAKKLAALFRENDKKFDMPEAVRAAGPRG